MKSAGKMTRTHSNQSLGILSSLTIPNNIWRSAACPCIKVPWKTARIRSKVIFQIGTLYSHRINERFSFNLFILAFHVITFRVNSSVAPSSLYEPHPTNDSPICSNEGLTLERQSSLNPCAMAPTDVTPLLYH